jgi:hypothetical protein
VVEGDGGKLLKFRICVDADLNPSQLACPHVQVRWSHAMAITLT